MIQLKPFQEPLDFIQLFATLVPSKNHKFSFKIKLDGDSEKVTIPRLLPVQERSQMHDLWRETCFEFFVSGNSQNSDSYIEFNLSPAGHWDLYFFDAYRQGMRRLPAAILTLNQTENLWELEIVLQDPLPWVPQYFNTTCVIKTNSGETSYWAPFHPSAKADFHDKSVWQSF